MLQRILLPLSPAELRLVMDAQSVVKAVLRRDLRLAREGLELFEESLEDIGGEEGWAGLMGRLLALGDKAHEI